MMFTVKRERQIASIILAHSHLAERWSRSIFAEKIAYSLTAKIGKLGPRRSDGPLEQHASRNRAEWNGGEGTENGVKMFPRKRNCHGWMSRWIKWESFLKEQRRIVFKNLKREEEISRGILRKKEMYPCCGERDYKKKDFEDIYKKDYKEDLWNLSKINTILNFPISSRLLISFRIKRKINK